MQMDVLDADDLRRKIVLGKGHASPPTMGTLHLTLCGLDVFCDI